jgi:hypothetical protein
MIVWVFTKDFLSIYDIMIYKTEVKKRIDKKSNRHHIIGILVGIILVVLVIIFFSVYFKKNETMPSKKSVHTPIGIKNIGNSCYINAVVQMLYHHEKLKAFIYENPDDPLYKIFKYLDKDDNLDEESIKKLRHGGPENCDPNDAHEVLMVILDKYTNPITNLPYHITLYNVAINFMDSLNEWSDYILSVSNFTQMYFDGNVFIHLQSPSLRNREYLIEKTLDLNNFEPFNHVGRRKLVTLKSAILHERCSVTSTELDHFTIVVNVENRWHYINDSVVKVFDENEAFEKINNNAYILHYITDQ